METTKINKETYNGPSYYGGTDCFDAMVKAYGEGPVYAFCKCNAFKYLWRADKKHKFPLEDLRKAMWYLDKALDLASTQVARQAVDRQMNQQDSNHED